MTETEFRNAMDDCGSTVYRLALCRMQNAADAEDVYQEVFLRLWKQDTAGWNGERLKAWLIRATVNRCADLHRLRLRRPVLALEELSDPASSDDEARALWAAVARLPQDQRTAVHLFYAEGYGAEEIAAMLGIPAATIRTRLHRGRKRLRELLGGDDDET